MKCQFCGLVLASRGSLRGHQNTYHPNRPQVQEGNPKMVCGMCKQCLPNNQEFDRHIRETHGVNVVHESLKFNSLEEFENWLCTIENTSKAKFVKVSVHKKSSEKTVSYYRCNRSGQPRISGVPPEKRKRKSKTQGSCKSTNHCSARITTTLYPDGTILVDFCGTHFGHRIELKHLPIKSPKKIDIAAQMPTKFLLGDIFDDIQQDELEPQNEISTFNSQDQALLINEERGSTGSVSPQELSNNIRKSVEESFYAVMNHIQSDKEMLIFGKLLESAIPVINAARTSSHYSVFESPEKLNVDNKIDSQRKVVCKKK
uniref:Putative zinc finger transcription factor protein 17 n=1 Tax=Lygus hesperus TaxID=30085 RepID=A0A0A9XCL4_LYGHE